jgi:hypothetical protein
MPDEVRRVLVAIHEPRDVLVIDEPRNRREVQPATFHSFWHGTHPASCALPSIEEMKLLAMLERGVLRLDSRVTLVAFLSAPYNLGDPSFAPIDTFDALRNRFPKVRHPLVQEVQGCP